MRIDFWNSWTVQEFRRCRRQMTALSAARFVALNRRPTDGSLTLSLRGRVHAGVMIRCRGSDAETVSEICLKGVYDRIAKLVSAPEYIVDLGANIGLATQYLATQFPAARILSVEPHPDNFAFLRKNASQFGERCLPIQAAIWNEDGEVALDCPEFNAVSVSSNGVIRVPAAKLQTLLRDACFPRIDVLKVDIEGAEVQLLRTADDWIDSVGCIAIEFHGDSRTESGFDSLMERHSFDVLDGSLHTVFALHRAAASLE